MVYIRKTAILTLNLYFYLKLGPFLQSSRNSYSYNTAIGCFNLNLLARLRTRWNSNC